MEEWVGKKWHRWITSTAEQDHAQAAVTLEEIRVTLAVLFRAFGGDGGLKIEAASGTEHGARRRFLQKVAGTGRAVPLAWRDESTLRLPDRIDLFAERERNRDLYLWLAALAAGEESPGLPLPWVARNQALTRIALARFPGLRERYGQLVAALQALRPDPDALPDGEAAQERVIRAALSDPDHTLELPWAARPPQPVHLWLHPSPPLLRAVRCSSEQDAPDGSPSGESKEPEKKQRRRAERTDMPDGEDGLVAIRMDAILSWAEFMNVDRTTDDDDEDAEKAAEDMDVMSVSRDSQPSVKRLRFDLDMPAAEYDDLPLSEGVTLPEWDYRKRELQPDRCCILPMEARHLGAPELPSHLRRTAKRLRNQFQALVQTRIWERGLADGSEVDLDAYLHFTTEKMSGHVAAGDNLYREFRNGNRDLACLLLADLSLSTDAAVNDDDRVIDVIRDSLHLFTEALSATGDRFAIHGFSSKRRDQVRVHKLKGFDERPDDRVRGRINAIKPGYYTRMGAAIRYSADLLSRQSASRQLLLILTDGKPNDLDKYEGRYGIEDTREAVREARKKGLFPFCVTIDREGGEYLPHLFGPDSFIVIRRPEELPKHLPLLYARLTAS
ncbi:nitric oxide reductase activation protein NorD [Thiohalomonas denitrificans]|uniref:nitric oxide reductase activation protein NorD n=1 Tax=Thiohalomonas denitrificans TaxID=415747 RepID=UPI0026F1CF4F|nr:VWA domain-containing protein [Thiohalomonas denitrificans]